MDWARARRWLEELLGTLGGDRAAGRAPVVVRPGRPLPVIGPSEPPPGRTGFRSAIGSVLTVIGPRPAIAIIPPPRAAWDERGWLERVNNRGRVYVGRYMVRSRSGQLLTFAGRITLRDGNVTPYIADPPPEIRRHRKGPCFQLTKAPWFRVHWHVPADNVDDALLYVERVLYEVLN
jgi:hypothetical protein